MFRQILLFVFGVLPASAFALSILLLVGEGVASHDIVMNRTSVGPLLVLAAALSGTTGLWIVCVRTNPPIRSKRDAYVFGIMLALGIGAAGFALILPSWWWRALDLCPIFTALSFYPAIWKAIAGKDVGVQPIE
jgi:hypothetical protein